MGITGIILYFTKLHFEGLLLLTMFGFAEVLESGIEKLAERSLKKLYELLPRVVKVVKDGEVISKKLDEVTEGEIAVVGKGERIPVDGIVVDGSAVVDESAITGEPVPREVNVNDKLLAGGLVITGSVFIKALRSGSKSLISRMIELVEKYKERKAVLETLVNRFSRYYLAIMLGVAAVVWLFAGYYKALIIIAVGCPSAFLVSVSATLLSSISIYSRRGIFIKGSKPIEELSKVKVLALDKTGTLTLGKLIFRRLIEIKDGIDEDEILAMVASVEIFSGHPVAKAIVDAAKERGLKIEAASDVQELTGVGIKGVVDGKEVYVGRAEEELIKKFDIREASVAVKVEINGEPVALMLFEDVVLDESKEVIDYLKRKMSKVVMITGDRRENAERIAKKLGIDEYYAELKPEDKVRIVERLKKECKCKIAVVGDGINDAPALAAADVGIAIGNLEMAGEAADIVITTGEIKALPQIYEYAKLTLRKTFENIGIILGAKTLAAVLGVLGLIPLWAAVGLGDDGGAAISMINIAYMGFMMSTSSYIRSKK
jgi:Cd2+/Zn2+-exporting ATPase